MDTPNSENKLFEVTKTFKKNEAVPVQKATMESQPSFQNDKLGQTSIFRTFVILPKTKASDFQNSDQLRTIQTDISNIRSFGEVPMISAKLGMQSLNENPGIKTETSLLKSNDKQMKLEEQLSSFQPPSIESKKSVYVGGHLVLQGRSPSSASSELKSEAFDNLSEIRNSESMVQIASSSFQLPQKKPFVPSMMAKIDFSEGDNMNDEVFRFRAPVIQNTTLPKLSGTESHNENSMMKDKTSKASTPGNRMRIQGKRSRLQYPRGLQMHPGKVMFPDSEQQQINNDHIVQPDSSNSFPFKHILPSELPSFQSSTNYVAEGDLVIILSTEGVSVRPKSSQYTREAGGRIIQSPSIELEEETNFQGELMSGDGRKLRDEADHNKDLEWNTLGAEEGKRINSNRSNNALESSYEDNGLTILQIFKPSEFNESLSIKFENENSKSNETSSFGIFNTLQLSSLGLFEMENEKAKKLELSNINDSIKTSELNEIKSKKIESVDNNSNSGAASIFDQSSLQWLKPLGLFNFEKTNEEEIEYFIIDCATENGTSQLNEMKSTQLESADGNTKSSAGSKFEQSSVTSLKPLELFNFENANAEEVENFNTDSVAENGTSHSSTNFSRLYQESLIASDNLFLFQTENTNPEGLNNNMGKETPQFGRTPNTEMRWWPSTTPPNESHIDVISKGISTLSEEHVNENNASDSFKNTTISLDNLEKFNGITKKESNESARVNFLSDDEETTADVSATVKGEEVDYITRLIADNYSKENKASVILLSNDVSAEASQLKYKDSINHNVTNISQQRKGNGIIQEGKRKASEIVFAQRNSSEIDNDLFDDDVEEIIAKNNNVSSFLRILEEILDEFSTEKSDQNNGNIKPMVSKQLYDFGGPKYLPDDINRNTGSIISGANNDINAEENSNYKKVNGNESLYFDVISKGISTLSEEHVNENNVSDSFKNTAISLDNLEKFNGITKKESNESTRANFLSDDEETTADVSATVKGEEVDYITRLIADNYLKENKASVILQANDISPEASQFKYKDSINYNVTNISQQRKGNGIIQENKRKASEIVFAQRNSSEIDNDLFDDDVGEIIAENNNESSNLSIFEELSDEYGIEKSDQNNGNIKPIVSKQLYDFDGPKYLPDDINRNRGTIISGANNDINAEENSNYKKVNGNESYYFSLYLKDFTTEETGIIENGNDQNTENTTFSHKKNEIAPETSSDIKYDYNNEKETLKFPYRFKREILDFPAYINNENIGNEPQAILKSLDDSTFKGMFSLKHSKTGNQNTQSKFSTHHQYQITDRNDSKGNIGKDFVDTSLLNLESKDEAIPVQRVTIESQPSFQNDKMGLTSNFKNLGILHEIKDSDFQNNDQWHIQTDISNIRSFGEVPMISANLGMHSLNENPGIKTEISRLPYNGKQMKLEEQLSSFQSPSIESEKSIYVGGHLVLQGRSPSSASSELKRMTSDNLSGIQNAESMVQMDSSSFQLSQKKPFISSKAANINFSEGDYMNAGIFRFRAPVIQNTTLAKLSGTESLNENSMMKDKTSKASTPGNRMIIQGKRSRLQYPWGLQMHPGKVMFPGSEQQQINNDHIVQPDSSNLFPFKPILRSKLSSFQSPTNYVVQDEPVIIQSKGRVPVKQKTSQFTLESGGGIIQLPIIKLRAETNSQVDLMNRDASKFIDAVNPNKELEWNTVGSEDGKRINSNGSNNVLKQSYEGNGSAISQIFSPSEINESLPIKLGKENSKSNEAPSFGISNKLQFRSLELFKSENENAKKTEHSKINGATEKGTLQLNEIKFTNVKSVDNNSKASVVSNFDLNNKESLNPLVLFNFKNANAKEADYFNTGSAVENGPSHSSQMHGLQNKGNHGKNTSGILQNISSSKFNETMSGQTKDTGKMINSKGFSRFSQESGIAFEPLISVQSKNTNPERLNNNMGKGTPQFERTHNTEMRWLPSMTSPNESYIDVISKGISTLSVEHVDENKASDSLKNTEISLDDLKKFNAIIKKENNESTRVNFLSDEEDIIADISLIFKDKKADAKKKTVPSIVDNYLNENKTSVILHANDVSPEVSQFKYKGSIDHKVNDTSRQRKENDITQENKIKASEIVFSQRSTIDNDFSDNVEEIIAENNNASNISRIFEELSEEYGIKKSDQNNGNIKPIVSQHLNDFDRPKYLPGDINRNRGSIISREHNETNADEISNYENGNGNEPLNFSPHLKHSKTGNQNILSKFSMHHEFRIVDSNDSKGNIGKHLADTSLQNLDSKDEAVPLQKMTIESQPSFQNDKMGLTSNFKTLGILPEIKASDFQNSDQWRTIQTDISNIQSFGELPMISAKLGMHSLNENRGIKTEASLLPSNGKQMKLEQLSSFQSPSIESGKAIYVGGQLVLRGRSPSSASSELKHMPLDNLSEIQNAESMVQMDSSSFQLKQKKPFIPSKVANINFSEGDNMNAEVFRFPAPVIQNTTLAKLSGTESHNENSMMKDETSKASSQGNRMRIQVKSSSLQYPGGLDMHPTKVMFAGSESLIPSKMSSQEHISNDHFGQLDSSNLFSFKPILQSKLSSFQSPIDHVVQDQSVSIHSKASLPVMQKTNRFALESDGRIIPLPSIKLGGETSFQGELMSGDGRKLRDEADRKKLSGISSKKPKYKKKVIFSPFQKLDDILG